MRGAFALSLSIAVHLFVVGIVVLAGAAGTDWLGTAWMDKTRVALRDQIGLGSTPDGDASAGPTPSADAPSASAKPPAGGQAASLAVAPATDPSADFGDWRHDCTRGDGGKPAICSITQRLIGAGSNIPLLVWQFLQDQNGGIVSLIRAPRDIAHDRGLVLVLTPGTEYRLPYSACLTGGCIARIDLTPEFRQALTSAEHIAMMVFSPDGRGVRFDISTRGLAEGMAALQNGEGGRTR